MTILVVITSPRPSGVSYVEATLDWLDPCAAPKFLLCDGIAIKRAGWTTVPVNKGWSVHHRPANKFAGWAALRLAVEKESDLVFLEDDVLPARTGVLDDIMNATVEPDAWVSFFHPSRPPGVYPRSLFMYSQALKMSFVTARWLLGLPGVIPGDWEGARGFDEALAAMDRGSLTCRSYRQAESIVRHVGIVSAANAHLGVQ